MTGLGKPPGCNNPDGYTGGNNERDCPVCGESVGNLPLHMRSPNCEVDKDE